MSTLVMDRYDPWSVLAERWPQTRVVLEPMTGSLLGEVRAGGRVIAVRRTSSPAQQRCTLAHEIVHLERGMHTLSWPLLQREELAVHRIAARRLIPLDALAPLLPALGDDGRALAAALDVDRYTLEVRLQALTAAESRALIPAAPDPLRTVA